MANRWTLIRRTLTPSVFTTAWCLYEYKAAVSPRAEVEAGDNLKLEPGVEISAFTKIKTSDGPLSIGQRVSIATGCFIASGAGGISIGKDSMIGPNVSIVGNNYRYDRLDIPISQQPHTSKGITIGEGVWIAAGCVVLDGAEIQDNVIVTPNSVVSGKVPAGKVIQGNPATAIFQRR